MKLATVMLLLLTGCMTRRPGDEYPWITHSDYRDDVIYNGVGVSW